MLLTISFAFLLTTLPMSVVNITATFWNAYREDYQRVARFKLARTITELLMYANHSMNFFLYCATGQKFRHQLVWMVCYAKRTYFVKRSGGGSGGGKGLEQQSPAWRVDSSIRNAKLCELRCRGQHDAIALKNTICRVRTSAGGL